MEEPSKYVLLRLKLENANKYCLFNLEKAVCNHGFFMMAPNAWCPLNKCLTRPLRIADHSTSSLVSITQPQTQSCDFLNVKVHGVDSVSVADKDAILDQVTRMLRLS
ncbi:hypothetical protein LIER_04081 [Lithospermum erythrorhizon]|uniref:Uncharacterized protein n=1 Tax=Lithospermum erythrorhizon TaxID=34254 RepID=A0AAV3NVE6_LITER